MSFNQAGVPVPVPPMVPKHKAILDVHLASARKRVPTPSKASLRRIVAARANTLNSPAVTEEQLTWYYGIARIADD